MSALSRLLDHRRFGMRPGLENILAASEALGSPHLRLGKVVHSFVQIIGMFAFSVACTLGT